ncbi:MAG TPA: VWA domain-containing protein [Pyrinomonadaceae bacterium]|nr:VWA domain-containing protein [Pyrinomonadaceae bacterium]
MKQKCFFSKLLAGTFFIFALQHSAVAQAECLTSLEIKQMLSKLNSGQNVSFDKKLNRELLEMKMNIIDRFQDKTRQNQRANNLTRGVFELETRVETLAKAIEKKKDKNEVRLCRMFREHGWLTKSLVGEDGAAAMFYLIKNVTSFEFQMELVPLIIAAANKNELAKNEDFASFLDRLRLRAGLKQLFGTQVSVKDGFLVLAPIQSEERVEKWRNAYNMPPLSQYIKFLEMNYQMPLIRAHSINPPRLKEPAKASKDNVTQALQSVSMTGEAPEEADVIRIETELVNLNIRVLNRDLKANIETLEQKDFKVFEDEREEKISFFAKTETPFDLVLLLDLSGSTYQKQGLIRKSAKRFIEAARPIDRIAIVTFTDKQKIITPLTSHRSTLLKGVEEIGGTGHSYVWDAVKFTLENVFTEKSAERRRAVVMMSDGVDNALMYSPFKFGSNASFGELVETVRRNDAVIIPIYLDTEERTPCSVNTGRVCNIGERAYDQARGTLSFLAEESGGQMYQARKLEDLEGVYEQVLNDLSAFYSIGYAPTNDSRDGSWRAIKVEIENRPDLIVRTKMGYYAK